jgi:hypothetical protein
MILELTAGADDGSASRGRRARVADAEPTNGNRLRRNSSTEDNSSTTPMAPSTAATVRTVPTGLRHDRNPPAVATGRLGRRRVGFPTPTDDPETSEERQDFEAEPVTTDTTQARDGRGDTRQARDDAKTVETMARESVKRPRRRPRGRPLRR